MSKDCPFDWDGDAARCAGTLLTLKPRGERLRGHSCSSVAFTLSALAFGQIMVPATAQAQCNSNSTPPPPSPVQSSFSNQSFGPTPPLTPYSANSRGLTGCVGENGGHGEAGAPGSPGQPGGQIDGTNSALTIIGGGNPNAGLQTFGARITSAGGNGGDGGQSGYVSNFDAIGGKGGAGAAGGRITLSFDGTFVPDATTGLATIGLSGTSIGGIGGAGGEVDDQGTYARQSGDGGTGGSSGAVALIASGSVQARQQGVSAASTGGNGGNGADAYTTGDLFDSAQAGAGGDGGGAGAASVQWLGGTVATSQFGLLATAEGGGGGSGGATGVSFTTATGGDGGAGGNGGPASVLLSGGAVTVNLASYLSYGSGISVNSNGGNGGIGGVSTYGTGARGGTGGAGGNGSSANGTLLGTVTYNGSSASGQVSGHGVLVQSNGGVGGRGGNATAIAGQAGGGGFAGAGGSSTLTIGSGTTAGSIRTSGNFAHGALVQSIGGGGGNGGQARFNADGGAGAAGGHGGAVEVDSVRGSVVVTGKNAVAILAQSIGGGGGSGGDTNDVAIGAQIAIGGNGGLGGDGGTVRLNLAQGVFASTSTLGGAGILAHSIGGSGGAGGSAVSEGIGILSMAIGGDAGGGGHGGPVNISSNALITTHGDHATGIQAQSIGGGGGKGGSSVSLVGGIVPVASVAVGGRGGGGGPAGDVSVSNTGQVTTYGPDAHGVLLQSIGGGGGTGGAAAARAVDLSPNKDIPAISISVTTGGAGGAGNTGGSVRLDSAGLIATAGDGAIGVMAQSIGGGGGTGGDSTAASYSGGNTGGGLSVSVSVAVGGAGGTGGTGSAVTIANQGLVATLGQDAYGVFAQSVGGGGGSGGGGDATASSNEAKGSFSTSIGIGGRGGTGGHAGTVGLTNSGAITTRGDGADGIFAQSVGGGGGAGGGGTATASGGNLAIAVGVGGSGGAGGDGNTATVQNSGSIVTRGTDAIGLSVQSIGGGGGKGGKGGATAGGVTTLSNAQALFDTLSNGLNINQRVVNLGDGILQIGQIGENIKATYDELHGIFTQPQAGDAENGTSVQISVSVSVGGSGGAAGNGGSVSATNTGAINTLGAQSDGIYAQSVGGGGGSAGGATSTSGASDDTPVQTAVGVGGRGGGGGSGGTVTVVNGASGSVLTQGVAAIGIFAQSVGGGGGEGSLAGTVSGSFKSLSVGVGGNGGTGGNGGEVSVATESGSTLTTTGKHGIGIFAQSVGGGGGLVRTMTTDQTFDPAKIVINPQGRIGDLHGLILTFGGQNGISGNGGAVVVTTNAPLITSGLDAHGVLAQSIGGGGGMVVGGRAQVPPGGTGGDGGAHGNGGSVTVRLQSGTVLRTSGDGAFGVLAQSIGGGGGAAGDFSAVSRYQLGTSDAVKASAGDGGAVSIAASQAQITTTGKFAPAIFAQSIGGGGGLMNINTTDATVTNVQARGTAGGAGVGGAVTISLTASQIVANGLGSTGILAQSDGTSSSQILVSLDQASTVSGGLPDSPTRQAPGEQDAAAVRLLGGTANRIDNAGVIGRSDSTGIAILTNTPKGNTTVTNSGKILGDIVMNDGVGSSIDNRSGGLISSPAAIQLNGGTLRNSGALHVGGTGTLGQTTLTGDLVQGPSGRLVVATNHGTAASDQLVVQGRASLSGTVEVHSAVLANRAVTVLSATDGLVVDPALSTTRTHLFRFDARQTGNSLQVQPVAEFQLGAASLGDNQRRVAAHLQELWDRGAKMDAGFTALAGIGDGAGYGRALNSLSGQTVGAIGVFRYSSSHNFINNMLNDCATVEGAGITLDEASCAWGRVFGSHSRQDSTSSALGYQTSAWTFQAGGQRQIAPGWFVGGSVAYESSEFRGDAGTSKVTGDSLLLGATLRYQAGPWQISGALDFGYGWYDSRRAIAVGSFGAMAVASPTAWHAGAHSRIAYQISFGGWYVQPRLDLHLTYVRSNGYTETGAGPFNLTVDADGGTTFAAVPAVEVGGRIRLSETAVFRPYASVGVQMTASNDWVTTARFAGQPASRGFRAKTPIPDVLGRFTVGAELLSRANWDFRLQYSAEVGDGYVSHTGVGRLAYRF